MELKILKNEENILEVELINGEHSIAQLLSNRLNEEDDVTFSASKVDHPLVSNPRFVVKTRDRNAKELVLEKIDELKEEVSNTKESFISAS